MRWLLIALLVSLAALLIAAAGGAWHIWLQSSRRSRTLASGQAPDSPPGSAKEPAAEEVETEIL
jgi:uncharacterized membrane protein